MWVRLWTPYLSLLGPDGDRDVVASPVDDKFVPLAVHDGGVRDDLHGTGTEIQSHLNPKRIIILIRIFVTRLKVVISLFQIKCLFR